MDDRWRQLTPRERAICERLLSLRFEGRDAASAQLTHAEARPWAECVEHCGSIELRVPDHAPLIVPTSPHDTPLPVEGRVDDADGVLVEVLLFQREGRLRHLEFVVFTDRIKQPVDPGLLTVHVS